jgi:hypothetical protein
VGYIVIRKSTGKAVLETHSVKVAKAINRKAYAVRTAHAYLVSLNRLIKRGQNV